MAFTCKRDQPVVDVTVVVAVDVVVDHAAVDVVAVVSEVKFLLIATGGGGGDGKFSVRKKFLLFTNKHNQNKNKSCLRKGKKQLKFD